MGTILIKHQHKT